MLKTCFILLMSMVLIKSTFAQNSENDLTISEKNSIERLETHDQRYIKQKGPSFFKRISRGQTPIFTIVTCSDSRVQANVLDDNPEGNFFMVRNIGNQLKTSMGSVDYGVSHLNTEILLIIGHSKCGAIDAVRNNYKHLTPDIVKELDAIHIGAGVSNITGVLQNVDNQVNIALKKYSRKINDNQLLVIGAVYDFADDMHKGAGELLIININGETKPVKLKKIINA